MNNKRVLYIGTPFFNYYLQIIEEFENQGYSVDFYNDRPSENAFIKGMIKIKKSLVNTLITNYFNRIMEETKSKDYDLIFIVNCKVFTPDMIRQLKESQKEAQFVLYMWDSLKLYPNSQSLIPLFERAYSFDLADCEKHNNLTFLPLFYGKKFEEIGQEQATDIKYDIVSVCTAHPNRYETIKQLFPLLQSEGITTFSYMFLNKLQFMYNRLFVKEFKRANPGEFNFQSLPEEENIKLLKQSRVVFDMPHKDQSGLTMRTIETLGANRKLITSNISIVKYDFYNENNIYVMDDYNIDAIKEFIYREYEPIDKDVYQKYSLKSWINSIIEGTDRKYIS